MSSEIRIRVKPVVKETLESIKEKYGFSITFQVNFALFKYLVLDLKIPLWRLEQEDGIPQYEDINKLPEDSKEGRYDWAIKQINKTNKKREIGGNIEMVEAFRETHGTHETDSKLRGEE